jgi:hypothetical protein
MTQSAGDRGILGKARLAGPWIGPLILLLCLLFFGRVLRDNVRQIADHPFNWREAAAVIAGSALLAATYLGLAQAWRRLVVLFEGCSAAPDLPLLRIYGISQLGKYLPGNVMHFAGRQIMARRLGFSHKSMAMASIFETAGMIVVAVALGGAGLIMAPALPALPGHVDLRVASLVCIAAVGLVAAIALVHRFRRVDAAGTAPRARGFWRTILLVLLLYALCFAAMPLVFSGIVYAAQGQWQPMSFFGILIVAWLLGYVTPGAPGGVGVREAIIVTGTAAVIGTADAVVYAVLFRVATVLADLELFLVARRFPQAEGSDISMELQEGRHDG